MAEQISSNQEKQISPVTDRQIETNGKTEPLGLSWPRLFGQGNPYDQIQWEIRTARITKGSGEVVF